MNSRSRLLMILHGAAVILLGLAAGIPYALVVTGSLAGEERAWRMAHAEGLQNGMLMLAVAGIGGRLVLDEKRSSSLAWSLIAASYGNVIASILGAATGNRGLEAVAPLANLVVFSLFVVAMGGVLTGLLLVVAGAREAMKKGLP